MSSLPPLSLSILGVDPLDEFIREIADFVHHMIQNRPELAGGLVEVEAKVGILRDRDRNGPRIMLPVLVETSMSSADNQGPLLQLTIFQFWRPMP